MVYKGGDDPTLRMLRSGFGKQVKSAEPTQPAYGFGTSHRDAVAKASVCSWRWMGVVLMRRRRRKGVMCLRNCCCWWGALSHGRMVHRMWWRV